MATLTAACAPPLRRPVTPPIKPDITIVTVTYSAPPPPKITPGHYPSLASALDAVMATRTPIIALGEIHQFDQTSTPSTAEQTFAVLFPIMKRYGRESLATELLPFGRQSDLEIADYNRNRTIRPGSLLDRWLKEVMYPDCRGTMRMLEAAAENGITLYGTNISSPEEYLALRGAGREDDLSSRVNQNTLDVIEILRSQNPTNQITAYNGARHNNTIPLTGEESHSFGQLFPANNYLEVDILLTSLLPTVPGRYLSEEIGRSIPETGVALLKRENRVTIILPRTATPPSCR